MSTRRNRYKATVPECVHQRLYKRQQNTIHICIVSSLISSVILEVGVQLWSGRIPPWEGTRCNGCIYSVSTNITKQISSKFLPEQPRRHFSKTPVDFYALATRGLPLTVAYDNPVFSVNVTITKICHTRHLIPYSFLPMLLQPNFSRIFD